MPVSRRRRGRAATQAARSGNLPISTKRKKTNKLYLAASLIIAVLVISSFAFASFTGGGGGGSNSGSAQAYVEGVGVQQDIMSSAIHVDRETEVVYSTAPPTSGNHWFDSQSPAACGFYEDGIDDRSITHNMEHGNIIVSYNLPGESQVDELKSAIDDIGLSRIWGITRSYDKIPVGQVAVAAWGVLDTMEGIDEGRLRTFFDTYAGALGPEFVTC